MASFVVPLKSDSILGGHMDLRQAIEAVVTLKYDHKLGDAQLAQKHLVELRKPSAIDEIPIGYKVLTSGKAQNIPVVPWIAVLDPDVTTTAKRGLYLVYLYALKRDRIYLSLNQGATYFQDQAKKQLKGVAADRRALQRLTEATEVMVNALSPDDLEGLDLKILLDVAKFLPRGYERGNIAAITYEAGSLPENAVLARDLDRMLKLYQTVIEVNSEIRDEDNEAAEKVAPTFATSQKKKWVPQFKPKSSEEYLVQIAKQTQVKSRKHEAVVASLGKYVESLQLTPATNVHPRDVCIRTSKREFLVEVKVVGRNAEECVRDAIGQLFSYRHFYYRSKGLADPRLIAAFNEDVGDALRELLESLGILWAYLQQGEWRLDPGIDW